LSKYKSRYEARYDTRYNTGYGSGLRNPNRVSIPEKSGPKAENRAGHKGVSTQKVGLKSRRLRTRITPKPVPRSLTEEGSVRGRSLHHLPLPENQPDKFVVVNVTSHGRTTQFFQPNISV